MEVEFEGFQGVSVVEGAVQHRGGLHFAFAEGEFFERSLLEEECGELGPRIGGCWVMRREKVASVSMDVFDDEDFQLDVASDQDLE